MSEKNVEEARELVALCLNCEEANCKGTCVKYRRVRQGLHKRPMGKRLYYELDGERLSLEEWAMRIGVTKECLRDRLRKMPLREALTMGKGSTVRIYTIDGVTMTAAQWAEHLNIPLNALRVYACREEVGIEQAIRHYLAKE